MLENHAQPRWGWLYLALPLAGGLYWLIARIRPLSVVRVLLELAVLLVVLGYVEVWRVANAVALLHQPLKGNGRTPIYYAYEATGFEALGSETGPEAVFIADSYSNLFQAPVSVAPPPSTPEEAPVSEASE